MITINPDEKIIITLKRHWLVFVSKLVLIIFLLIGPILLLWLLAISKISLPIPNQLYWLLTIIFYLFLWLYLFINWIDYYLDIWIVTDQRVIDVEQLGLFQREISEFSLDKIQDITVEIVGVLPTLFNYGDVHIQTAGESRQFIFHQVPKPHKAKDLILKLHDLKLLKRL